MTNPRPNVFKDSEGRVSVVVKETAPSDKQARWLREAGFDDANIMKFKKRQASVLVGLYFVLVASNKDMKETMHNAIDFMFAHPRSEIKREQRKRGMRQGKPPTPEGSPQRNVEPQNEEVF